MARKKWQVIQSVMVSKEYAPNLKTAKLWVKRCGLRVGDQDETANFWRFRQFDPELFVKNTFRTHHITHGIRSLVGRPRPEFRAAFLPVEGE